MGVVVLVALLAVAQPERLSGLAIDRIDVEAAPEEDVARVLSLSGLAVGGPYSQSEIRRAVKVLHQLGRFENVFVFAARVENAVHLTLKLPPKPRIREIEVAASEELGSEALELALGWKIGDEVDDRDLAARRNRVSEALERLGYRQAAVGLALEPIDENGGQRLIVRIDEGPETKLGKIVVQGRPRMALGQLGREIGMQGGEVLDLSRVERGLKRLRATYVERGYLDAKIEEPSVRETDRIEGGHPIADLVLPVEAGPKVAVRFKGNHVVPRRELDAAAGILAELGTTKSAVAEAREGILRRYEARGHYRARVEPSVRTTSDGSKKQVLFSIDEGKGARVASVSFPGNVGVDEDELRDQVFEAVEQTLSEDLGKPGADPNTIGQILGDASLGMRTTQQPANVAPDKEAIYVPRAYETARSPIRSVYQARGYQNVAVGSPEVKERGGGRLIDVVIPIDPGVRWVVGALSFSGNDAVGSEELYGLAKFPFDPMKPDPVALSFEQVIQTQNAIRDHYRNLGYLYANVGYELRQIPVRGSLEPALYVTTSSSAPLDVREICRRAAETGRDSCDVEVNFRVAEGPQVKTREVIVRGLDVTREGIVNGEIEVDGEGVLTERDLVGTRDNLLRVGVFERVVVHPIDEEQVASEKDVVVEVKERKYWSAELGIGASTGEGVRLFAGFGHSNVGGTALRFQSSGKVNYQLPPFLLLYGNEARENIEAFYAQFNTGQKIEYELTAGLSYPRIFGLPRGFSAGLDLIALRDLDPRFAEDTQVLTLVGDYKGFRPELLGNQRPIALQIRAALERSDLRCNPLVLDPNDPDGQFCTRADNRVAGSTFYTTVGPRVSWDLRDDPLDPRAGAFLEVGGDIALGLASSSPHFGELEGRANIYVPLADRVVFTAAFYGQKIWPFDPVDEIPANKRVYDDNRIRGYQLKTLLPQDIKQTPGKPLSAISPGGLLFLGIQTEIRFQVYGPLWLAAFYDAGDLWADGTPSIKTGRRAIAQGAGVGLEVSTPIGPLSIDFAVPINVRDPGAQGLTVHFSVGTF